MRSFLHFDANVRVDRMITHAAGLIGWFSEDEIIERLVKEDATPGEAFHAVKAAAILYEDRRKAVEASVVAKHGT